MAVVSLVLLTIGAGGYARNFAELLILFSMFWGLPLLALMSVFHFLDKRFGRYARYPIAAIGLFPLFLVIHVGRGDPTFMMASVLSGFAWSAVWLITSHVFASRSPQSIQAANGQQAT